MARPSDCVCGHDYRDHTLLEIDQRRGCEMCACEEWRTPPCSECEHIKANGGFGPPHNASPRCQSGGHNHCTCDTCF
jgi:hypothetical protein